MLMLIVGVVLLAGALVTIVVAVSSGAGTVTGVARSLDLIEKTIDRHEVGKSELPAMERLVAPVLARTRAIAVRLSPTGANDSLVRRLDLAGNPSTWTAERIMGTKGVGLLVGAVLGLAFGGVSLKGLLIAAAAGAAGFFLPDLLLMNIG